MSETAPGQNAPAPRPLTPEQAELAKVEARAEELRFQVQQNEAFGKYDEAPAVRNPGELTHSEYHAQRPSDGIVREGSRLRDTRTGSFASTEDYLDQRGDGNKVARDKHYDEVNGLNVKTTEAFGNEAEKPDYTSMGASELADRVAQALHAGDVTKAAEVHAAFETNSLEKVTRPGSNMGEVDHQRAMDRFNKLIGDAVAAGPKTEREKYETVAERPRYEEMDIDALVFATAKAMEVGDRAEVEEIRKAYETPFLEEVTRPGSTLDPAEHEAVMERFDKLVEAAIAYERIKNPDRAAELDKANKIVAKNERGPNVLDKAKAWWGKSREWAKSNFRPALMMAWWQTKGGLNLGVKDGMDPTQIENIRKRNRLVLSYGRLALGVAAVVGIGYGIGFHNGMNETAAAVAPDIDGANGGGEAFSTEDQAAIDALTPGTSANETVPVVADRFEAQLDANVGDRFEEQLAAEQAAVPSIEVDPAFNVGDGEGGYELFNNLGIDTAKWDANAESFLTNYPNDFKRLPDGTVGLAHQGLLSVPAQDAINALK